MNLVGQKILIYSLCLIILISSFVITPVQADTTLTIDQITINTTLPGVNGGAQAQIKWHTNKPAYGQLRYGVDTKNLNYSAVTSGLPQNEYTVSLAGLKSETTYYFVILASINTESVTSFTRGFKTIKVVGTDIPEFTENISRIDTTAHSVTFQWTTDKETSATIFYGTNQDKLSSSAGQSGRNTEHEITIKGLKPATLYYYRAQIKDKDNNLANYYIDSFRTLDTDSTEQLPLTVTDLRPNTITDSRVSENSLNITFNTNRPTKATITLRGKSGTKTIKTPVLSSTIHSYVISGLTPGTSYDATIDLTDVLGKTLKLDKLTFATKELTKTPVTITTASAQSRYVSPTVRLIKTADRATVYAVVSPLESGSVCLASVATKVQPTLGWRAEYFNWDTTVAGLDGNDTKAIPSSPLITGWYQSQYIVKNSIDPKLTFGDRFFPLDEFKDPKQSHNYLFGAHWSGVLQVPATGQYQYSLSSDDDSWVLIDNQVAINNGGPHGNKTIKGSVSLSGGQHTIDVYYADRRGPSAVMSFSFTDSRLIVTTGASQISCPANQIKAASVKLHPITNPTVFESYGYQWKNVETVSNKELARFQPAHLVRTANDPTVYYIDSIRHLKMAIPNEAIFNSYSGNKWSDIIYVVPQDLATYHTVELVKEVGSQTTYLLQGNVIHPFASLTALTVHGYNPQDTLTINSYHLSIFTRGDTIQ